MSHEISIILSTYMSDDYIENYYINFNELINVAKIQLVHVLNNPTTLEQSYIEKFLKLQSKLGKINFEYKYVVVERETLYTSWNRAIKLADSRLITISNVDDIRYPKGLKKQISEFKNISGNRMLLLGSYSNMRTSNDLIIQEKKKMFKKNDSDFLNSFYIGAFFVWTNPNFVGLNHILFDEQFTVAGDFDFQIRFTVFGSIKMLDENVGEYLNIGKGLSTGSILQPIETQVIYKRYRVVDKKIAYFSKFFFRNKYYPFLLKINSIMYPLDKACPQINNIRSINLKRKKFIFSYFTDFLILIKNIIKKFIFKVR